MKPQYATLLLLCATILTLSTTASAASDDFTESFNGSGCPAGWTCTGTVTRTNYAPPGSGAVAPALSLHLGGSSVSRFIPTLEWDEGYLFGTWLSYGQTLPGEMLLLNVCSPVDCVTQDLTDVDPNTVLWELVALDISPVLPADDVFVEIHLFDEANMGAADDRGFFDSLILDGTAPPAPVYVFDDFDRASLGPNWTWYWSEPQLANGKAGFGSGSWAFIAQYVAEAFPHDQYATLSVPEGVFLYQSTQVFVLRALGGGVARYATGCDRYWNDFDAPDLPEGNNPYQGLSYIKFDGVPGPQTWTEYGEPCVPQDAGELLTIEVMGTDPTVIRGYQDGALLIEVAHYGGGQLLAGYPGFVASGAQWPEPWPAPFNTPVAEWFEAGSL